MKESPYLKLESGTDKESLFRICFDVKPDGFFERWMKNESVRPSNVFVRFEHTERPSADIYVEDKPRVADLGDRPGTRSYTTSRSSRVPVETMIEIESHRRDIHRESMVGRIERQGVQVKDIYDACNAEKADVRQDDKPVLLELIARSCRLLGYESKHKTDPAVKARLEGKAYDSTSANNVSPQEPSPKTIG